MTIEEMQTQLDKMRDDINKALAEVTEYEELIREIKAQEEPKFERREGKLYFWVSTNNGKAECIASTDDAGRYDKPWYDNNNYFYTAERAQEVADKINFLLKLERLHDTYCPDYVPDWDDDEDLKWYVYYDVSDEKFIAENNRITRRCVDVCFDSFETANKVCDILNKEREENE